MYVLLIYKKTEKAWKTSVVNTYIINWIEVDIVYNWTEN